MTVSYQYEVASSTSGGFTRLLFMWKGSLYKLIYRELLLFLVAFGVLSALYRHAFNKDQKRLFEKVVIYCDTFINLIPLSFVLGFYVAYVAGRWWQQYMAIPWPDKIMHSIALYVNGNDEHGRILRRTLMRYLNASLVLVLRSISSAVKRRFPTLEHMVKAGFMTTIELEMYQSVPSIEFNTYWIPCTWFIMLLKESKNTRINDAQGLKIIMEEFNEFRSKCGLLWSYDWVSIPLVYTQVVTIATYSFFMAALVGRQFVDEAKKPFQMEIDIYVPVFTILQFFFFMGLLKVAEQIINPFGDDDEDFELNWLIDRHTKVSYLGVDLLMMRAPPLVKDMYFDDVDLALPYTEAAVAYKKKTYRGSVYNMTVPEEQHTMFLPEITEEDEDKPASTPRSSTVNLQETSSTAAAPGAATAAGIWWSHSSSQSLCKSLDQSDNIPPQLLEEGLGVAHAFPTSKKDQLLSKYGTRRPVMRSESAPTMKKPTLTEAMEAWPSVSTLCQSQLSFHVSQVSLDGSSQPGPISCVPSTNPDNSEHTPKPSPWPPVPADLKPRSSTSNFEDVIENLLKSQQSKSNRKPKMKSCPKLIQVRRQSPSGGNRRKGVRWKPIVQGLSGAVIQRRRTVDVVPEIVGGSPTRDVPLYCTQCQNMVERKSSAGSSTIFDTHPVPNTRLEGWAYAGQHFLSVLDNNQEEGTVSAPNLTSSEIAKINSKGATSWQHKLSSGFLKKIGLGNKKHRKSDLAPFRNVSPITFVESPKWTNGRKIVSQSLPNIVFPNTCSSSMISLRSADKPRNHPKDVAQMEEATQEYKTNGNVLNEAVNGTEMATDSSDNNLATNLARRLSSNSSSSTGSFREKGSWKSADWSTLLNGSACDLELLPSLDSSLNVHVNNPSDKDEVLEEVIINREHSPNTRWS